MHTGARRAVPSTELSRLLSDSDMVGGGSGGRRPSSDVQRQFAQSGGMRAEKFLRSFCRYCHSNPFYCGEMLQLCYAETRAVDF